MFKKTYLNLTLRLETFTHTVPLPFAIYFSVVTGTGSYLSKDEMFTVALAGSINATALIILGCVWRWFYLKKIFREIKSIYKDSSKSTEDKVKLKIRLLKYPFKEAKIIVLRWITGIIGSHLFILFVAGPRPGLHLTAPFLFLMITPISYIAYFFISENVISAVFKLRKVKQIEIAINQIPQFNSFQRITLSMVAITIMPIIVLGYMLYGLKLGLVKLDDPGTHLIIMSILFPIPVIIVGYVIAKTFRNGIMGINNHLNQLGKGNFSVVSMPTSSDDFGLQAYNLNQIIKKLRSLYREVSDLNLNLENKVEIRTEELNSSLKKVEALKIQQDGDYFLTSLLLKPLGQNLATSDNFDFTFFVKQKKDFEFRGKFYEIGGDTCVTHTIKLQGKVYHVFLNGDAMGKSIQGAGGSLILGSVFQAIIERTLFSPNLAEQSPELWLKNAFIEMHKVFESFSGSMLVSIVFGLLDNSNGFTYYINAEHPPSILFRDGIAHYIEEESHFRKLGTLQINSSIFIQTLQLHHGDILLIGSDGRDDIRIIDETHIANVNSDPKRILKVIELTSCNLSKIFELLSSYGELTDDLSLLKIHFHKNAQIHPKSHLEIELILNQVNEHINNKNFKEALSILMDKSKDLPEEHEFLKYQSQVFALQGDFENAINFGIRYINLVPSDNKYFLTLSVYYKTFGDLSNGIEIGERLRLREPENLINIIQLSELYFLNKNYERAQELIQYALKLEPGNSTAIYLRQKIKHQTQSQ
ncbi:MAG: SpoIIE family protein phosphatase [Leptospiraceae bacterium]|nr:SpoIIE family protein phosphatase [Leptospiraceae bacterium]